MNARYMIILGPKNLGKNIDVFLRPLIDELKMLWDIGVKNYDTSMIQNFQMKVTLIWTISNFLLMPCCLDGVLIEG